VGSTPARASKKIKHLAPVVSGQAKIAGDAQAPSSKSGKVSQMPARIAVHFHRLRPVALLLSAAALFAASTSVRAAPLYKFTDLGTLGGTYSYASAINDTGQVVGYSHTIGNAAYYATLWDVGATASNLGTLPGGAYSSASALNDAGDVAGYSYTASGTHHATVWSGTSATDLGTLGGTHSYATAINTSGQLAGYSNPTGSYSFHATLWSGTTATDLGTLGGASSFARSINTSGHVVGYADITGNAHQHATLWNGTSVTDLGTMGGTDSLAIAINDTDQVVGISYIAAVQHATLWDGIASIDLGGPDTGALAINSAGQVVGWTRTAGTAVVRATLWNGTSATDLNSFLDTSTVSAGWVLNSATGINNDGWIVGDASNVLLGISNHAFLLAPVPEPPSFILYLLGLAALWCTSHTNKVTRQTQFEKKGRAFPKEQPNSQNPGAPCLRRLSYPHVAAHLVALRNVGRRG
jgi:probable HAF family extracellular repeat protein